jgi:3-hydroxymyristoyl/3-hydroxydecanoyl-(acyl carrier protein) dehydratase
MRSTNRFQGRFGKPIMPGVLVLRPWPRSGIRVQTTSDGGQLVIFLAIDHAKFRKPVIPGDQLRMEVKVLQRRDPYWRLRGEAYVDDVLVCEMEFKAMVAPREAS